MADNLVILVIVAVAIPFVVVGILWLSAGAMDKVAGSRKVRIVIAVLGIVIWVAMAVDDLVRGRRLWWLTALGTAVWIPMLFAEIRRPDGRKTPVERVRI